MTGSVDASGGEMRPQEEQPAVDTLDEAAIIRRAVTRETPYAYLGGSYGPVTCILQFTGGLRVTIEREGHGDATPQG